MKFRDLLDSVAFLFLKKKCYASVCKVASRDKCQEANLLEVGYFPSERFLAVATEASNTEHCQKQDRELEELLT